MEVKSVMHRVLRRFRFSVPEGYRMPYPLVPIAKPRDGLPIELRLFQSQGRFPLAPMRPGAARSDLGTCARRVL